MPPTKQILTPEEARIKLDRVRELAKLRQRKYYANNKTEVLSYQKERNKELKAKAAPPAPAPAPAPAREHQAAAIALLELAANQAPAPAPQPKKRTQTKAQQKANENAVNNNTNPNKEMTKQNIIDKFKTTALFTSDGNRKINIDKITDVFNMVGDDKNLYDYIHEAATIADIIDNAKQKSNSSKTYADTSKVAFINSVIKACDVFTLKEPQGVDYEGLWYYYKFFKLKADLKQTAVNTNTEDAVMNYDEYVNKIKTKFGIYSVEHLIANLYRDAPLRNNYSKIKIANKNPIPNVNCIVLPEDVYNGVATIHLTDYKTKGRYGDKQIKLSLYTTRILLNYINTNNIQNVLFNSDISKTIISKMNAKIGVKGSVNEIRHMIVSTLYWKKNTMDTNELAHKIMKQVEILGHQVKTWFSYVRKIE